MEFSRPEYWSGLPCPPPMDLPDPGSEPTSRVSCVWQAGSLPLAPPRKPSAIRILTQLRGQAPLGSRHQSWGSQGHLHYGLLGTASGLLSEGKAGFCGTSPHRTWEICLRQVEEKGSNAETEPERGGCTHADRTEKEPAACGGSWAWCICGAERGRCAETWHTQGKGGGEARSQIKQGLLLSAGGLGGLFWADSSFTKMSLASVWRTDWRVKNGGRAPRKRWASATLADSHVDGHDLEVTPTRLLGTKTWNVPQIPKNIGQPLKVTLPKNT